MIIRNSVHAPFMKKRFSIEEIKSRIIGEPFELVSTEYVNAHEKLEWHCFVCGNNFFSNWCNISNGWKCPKCKAIAAGHRMKETVKRIYNMVTAEELYSALQSKNIELVGEIRNFNAKTKLSFRCGLCGNVFKSQVGDICRKWKHPGCWACSMPRGSNHFHWRGGTSEYPAEWTIDLRERIRNRDNRMCQFPNCEYSDAFGTKRLHVHHINSNKQNCGEYNLISLCSKHHLHVEMTNPQEWQDYFYSITADYEIR